MRIVVLSRGDLFPAQHGAAVKIVRTAEALAAAGDDVWVVTEDRDAYWRVRCGDAWERVAYSPRFRALQELPPLRSQALYERLCRAIGYPADEVFLYRAAVDPAWWARALHVGVRVGAQVMHAEFPGYAAPAWIAGRLLGTRVVVGTHNAEFERLRQTTALPAPVLGRLRRVEAGLLRLADAVVACSGVDRDALLRAGVPPGRTWLVPHGVDNAAYDVPPLDLHARYGLPPGPVVAFHGTLHYKPNTDAVRFLAEQLAPRLPSGSILAMGMNPPRALEGPRLRFTGAVDDLAAHLRAADLYVVPLDAGSGTRMKILEAFAAGRAVVSTPVGAEGLAVEDGREIVLASPETFVDAVLALLEDPARRERLGHAARAHARARDWTDVGRAWAEIHRGRGADFVPRPDIEAHLPPRTPSKPLQMLLLLNRGCNLRCAFCDLWEGRENLPLPRAEALFDEAVAIGTRGVVLTGGEPTLHPELPAIVRAAKARGLAVNLTTNGTTLDRHYVRLRDAGLDSLSISIDGLPDTHDRLRGRPGAHARSWRQLLRVLHDGRVDASVYFTVTRDNVHELVAVHDAVRAAGAAFDFWPVNDAPELALTRPEDREAWRRAVATLSSQDPAIAARRAYYEAGLDYHAGVRVPMRCLGLIDQYGVTYDGRLLPCCVWGAEGIAVGNVFERPLRELWRDPATQAARTRMFHDGCDAGCYNHSLYEFTASTGLDHRVERR